MELAALKESLRKLAPNAVPVWTPDDQGDSLPTGNDQLDELLAGGLPEGSITELSGDRSSGKTALALSMAKARTDAGQLVAYLNTTGQFYPPAAAALGVDLRLLLVISFPKLALRPGAHPHQLDRGSRSQPRDKRLSKLDPTAALARATDILIRSKHFPLIIIDLPNPRLLPAKRAARLRQNAHASGAAVLTLARDPGATASATMRMRVWPHSSDRGTRRLEVRLEKSPRTGTRQSAVIHLSSHLVDHAPPRAIAKPLHRTAPGVAPKPPPRAIAKPLHRTAPGVATKPPPRAIAQPLHRTASGLAPKPTVRALAHQMSLQGVP